MARKPAEKNVPSCLRATLAAITLSSLLAIAVISALIQNRSRLIERQTAARRARVAVEQLKQTMQILTDAETGVRGHLLRQTIAGKPKENYLEPFEQAQEKLPENLAKVKELVSNDPDQVKRYQVLERASWIRIKHLDFTLQKFSSADAEELSTVLDDGKHEMDQFRRIQSQMEATEHRKVDIGLKNYFALQSRQTQLLNVLATCIGIIFASVAFEIWQELRQEGAKLIEARSEAEARAFEVQVLENTAQARAKTAAKIAHDIKHWLQPIMYHVEMLERSGEKYPERIPKRLERIKDAVSTIDRLAKDTVLVFQADAGKLETQIEPVNLVQLVTIAIEDAGSVKHSISFSLLGTPNVVLCDRGLIDRAIRNLINNAIKYSPHGGRIHIQLKFNNAISILVADQGIGIPKEKRDNVFQEFHRAENTEAIPGTGLGLAVVRAAAIVHGGDVSVESQPGLKVEGLEDKFCTIFELRLKA